MYNGKVNIDKNTNTKAGIFVKFLQSIGIDGGVVGENSNKDSEGWSFRNLETVEFVPSDVYIAQAVGDTNVQDWLYTQTKIAYGALPTLGYAKSKCLNIGVGVDLTPLGVPANIVQISEYKATWVFLRAEIMTGPFVFAFRLRKVKLYSSEDTKQEDVKGGTLLGVGSKDEDELKPKFNVVVK